MPTHERRARPVRTIGELLEIQSRKEANERRELEMLSKVFGKEQETRDRLEYQEFDRAQRFQDGLEYEAAMREERDDD